MKNVGTNETKGKIIDTLQDQMIKLQNKISRMKLWAQ